MSDNWIEDKDIDELDENEVARCPDCGAEMDKDETVCPECGAEFGFFCPECDREIDPDATECPHCGAELDEGFYDEIELDYEDDDDTEASDEEVDERFIVRAEFCASCGEPIAEQDEECPSCGMDLCTDCGHPLDADDEICPYCGAEFAFSCPDCGQDLPSDANTCPHCGFSFDDEEDEDENGEED